MAVPARAEMDGALFARMEQEARARGFGVTLDGASADDVGG